MKPPTRTPPKFYSHPFLFLLLLASLLLPVAGRTASISYLSYSNLFVVTTNNGASPQSALVLGSDGATLFGTTLLSGTNGVGTIFKVNLDGSGFQTLHGFTGAPADGGLGIFRPLGNSGNLGGLLLGKDGYLYGTTYYGGLNNAGTIYKIGQDGNGYQVIHSFDFEVPIAPVIQGQDGALYGTGLHGALFRMNPDGTGYAVITHLHNQFSYSGLMQGTDGLLYGADQNSAGDYELFAVSTNGSGFTVVHTFSSSEGLRPYGTPYQAANGMLLGTLYTGGSAGVGIIYLVNTNGSNFQVVHNFADGSTPSDGSLPTSGLVLGGDGWLYGTTSGDSVFNNGIYKIKPDGSGYQQIYLFTDQSGDGAAAFGSVTAGSFQGSTGALFGTTTHGGTADHGTVYSIVVNPPLSITPGSITAGGQTTLFWPSWAVSYQLQSTTNLTTGTWSNITSGTPIIGLQVAASNSAAFFRLVSPE